MKILLNLAIIAFLTSSASFAADPPVFVRLQLPGVSLDDALAFYSHITKRKVWVALGVRATVSIENAADISVPEALRIIQTTLLEQNGIELKESDAGETFVTWSDDPRYLHLATPSTKPFGQNPKLPKPK